METWFAIIVTLCISALLASFFNSLFNSQTKPRHRRLPPGPPSIPLISRLILLRKSGSQIESYIRSLHSKYGPIVTLPTGSRPAIFVFSRSLAHEALVHNGAVFSHRPDPLPIGKILTCEQHNINSAGYGVTWRLLRRNLTAEILHPSRVKSYSHARKWVMDILLNRLKSAGESGPVKVIDHLHYAMFCLLVLMCFGDKLSEEQINQIETVHRRLLIGLSRFQVLDFWPRLTKILFQSRWKEFLELEKNQVDVVTPMIRARKEMKLNRETKEEENGLQNRVVCYADTLLDLELEEDGGKRKLKESEMVTLCAEFLNAGTDTTATALQWILANIVKSPSIQGKLVEEINGVVGGEAEEVREEDLGRMPYLRAVILEGLRRHPPGHFVLPHAVTKEVELGGYRVPKNAVINFMVADMGWDPEVWEDPMEFKPERFLHKESGEEFDLTGSREIKMMPFGVGRRICPGYGLATLHLEYFVANLVRKLEWKAVEGVGVDLSEKPEFTIVMDHPLQAHILPRTEKI